MQDVLVTIIRKIRTFKGEAAFSSWVYRIAANAAHGKSRRGRGARSAVSVESYLPLFNGRHAEPGSDWSRRPDDAAMAGELKTAIERSLGELPADYRAVILLHDVDGLPNEEVAGILGLTVAAVKSRVHRARVFLRRKLGPVFSPSH